MLAWILEYAQLAPGFLVGGLSATRRARSDAPHPARTEGRTFRLASPTFNRTRRLRSASSVSHLGKPSPTLVDYLGVMERTVSGRGQECVARTSMAKRPITNHVNRVVGITQLTTGHLKVDSSWMRLPFADDSRAAVMISKTCRACSGVASSSLPVTRHSAASTAPCCQT